ncbi:DNA polymerase epsilon subunit 3-like [Ruditapes philippinarum]|uniref:DNA polymerase epsilon subunit 3-like n=1 Tax=Ruditapes philippinarum TaxID=129788 RepID=UPI00295A7DA4|nr:DNA polymerase epsilon subunit 3-like [Ruditapes philippinarum]XP_060555697.1 DNA polymerase epsilon subunit 3-like [Ruditapes philippinarum]XP_060555698.1 DNA polymerase epsilon subunit 3-like [Ruditapes philippinarum]
MAERPEDLNLPNAVITRIIKDAIPDGVNVSKEARLAISKAASVFVLYATSCSNNFALKSKRKTITAKDVLDALEDMEFDQFVDPLKECLEAFKKNQQGKKDQKKKEKESVNVSGSGDAEDEGVVVLEEESGEDNGEEGGQEGGGAINGGEGDVVEISDTSED